MAGNADKIEVKGEKKHDSTASSSDRDTVKKHKRKCKRTRSTSTHSSSSGSSPVRKSKKKLKKRKSRDSSTSSSDSSEEFKRKRRKKEKKRAKKLKKKLKKEKKKEDKKNKVQNKTDEPEQNESADIPIDLMERSKAMAPMTKEEWDKRQSVVRKVYDEETGRHRLIKGDGEVIEEIVSRDRHKDINRQATVGDGNFFQSKLSAALK